MNKSVIFTTLTFLAYVSSCGLAGPSAGNITPAGVVWDIDNTGSIASYETTVLGQPKVIKTEKGKAVEFDSVKDGLIVEALPLEGAAKFTLEIIFRPDPNGPQAQRFLHLNENNMKSRILIETRLPGDGQWYLDTYIHTEKGNRTLVDKVGHRHPLGQWYNAALIYDGREMRHYVNGVMEKAGPLEFQPLKQGKTSVGVRMNKVHWFKGAIAKVRFTRGVLQPQQFLKP